MKLQVRCQLPFETKHSPNPGKTQPVSGIRTNKEELRKEWQRRAGREEEWRRRFYRPCWQYGISIKGPNSALNYPLLLSSVQPYNHRLFGCVRESSGKKEEMKRAAGKICIFAIVFTCINFLLQSLMWRGEKKEALFSPFTYLVSLVHLFPWTSKANFQYVMKDKSCWTPSNLQVHLFYEQ